MEREYIGRYHVLQQLGEGGMGTVVRAVDEVRQREVAIKLPSENDPQVVSRLQQECDVLAQLQHHHIVQVFGSGSDTGLPLYVVMEYVDGTTVEALLRQQPEHRLEPRRALEIARDVAEALAYAHRPPKRIIHRDIKPANILVRDKDGVVKVTDFGIAAVLAERAGITAVGTMAYMAPEQAKGQGADERADLYALGALFYEMLTGQRPPQLAVSQATPPGAVPGVLLPAEMRERIDRLALGLLERDPNRRFPTSAADVAEELRALLEGRPSPLKMVGQPGDARPSQPTERASRPLHEPISPDLLPRPKARQPKPALQPQPVRARPSRGPVAPVMPVAPVITVVPSVVGPLGSGKALASLIIGIFALLFSCFFSGLGVIGLAAGSTTLGLLSLAMQVLPGLIGVTLGHVALWEIRKSAGQLVGSGQAIAGLVMGYASLGLALLVFLTFYRS